MNPTLQALPHPHTVEVFEQHLGPLRHCELISKSNNKVFKAHTATQVYILKEVTDVTVDAVQEALLIQQMGQPLVCRQIHLVDTTGPHVVVVAEFITGTSLDQVLLLGEYSQEQARHWASTLVDTFKKVAGVPALGYGVAGAGKPASFGTWGAFLASYLQEQKNKGPVMAQHGFDRLWGLFSILRGHLDASSPSPTTVLADVNTRNFMVDHQGNLRLVHVPIVRHGDPVAPYGELLIHLHGSRLLKEVLALQPHPRWQTSFYAAFTAYVVLVFIERFVPLPLHEALPWGGNTPLLSLFHQHLDACEEELGYGQ